MANVEKGGGGEITGKEGERLKRKTKTKRRRGVSRPVDTDAKEGKSSETT